MKFAEFSVGITKIMENKFRHIAEEIRREVEDFLVRVGLLCRVFARGKDDLSLNSKLRREYGKYSIGGRLVQDAVGLRVALYFAEDIEIVEQLLRSKYDLDESSSTIDAPNTDQFTVSRHNLIFRIPAALMSDMHRNIGSLPIDTTFELQLRSVLSEGWHEVDHDLRYKSKNNWLGQDDLGRALNGIMATLETSEWSMRRIFDDLAYRHYKKRNWAAMLYSKVRMRAGTELSADIISLMNSNNDFAKEIFRINRRKVIKCFAHSKPALPINLNNIIYIWNYLGPKNHLASELAPDIVIEAIQDIPTSDLN